ncbi:hypothetical protein OW763_05475 [Clostridium aestuarii]|uniref:HNH endonuclease n=1 Tax=Clostridium aestuarii TaxID=338193 RepID=A0ABT4CXT6_9CLOT|nr:hypothetical protein [Clostridium aestuarii]MCY6483798.1 hypothetical protein [Clostridium aestuarii]
MGNNIFLLDMPNFSPQYKKDILYSYKGKGKDNLKQVLTEASKGHCMYCYTKILIDRKNLGELEHSIEKFNCDKLKNCPSNIAIACSKCNGSFKKKGEKIRALTVEEVKDFELISECGVTCIESCSKYNEIRRIYTEKEGGQIILQPFGIKNKITGRDYLIQYDLLNQKFIPSNIYPYNDEEKQFIQKHINRFNLNDSKYRTKEFSKFLQDVIEYKVIPKKNRYCNLVVDLFIEKIKGFSKEKSIKLCELIYTQILIKSKN